MSVQSADSSSTHKFPWKWNLRDLKKSDGPTVFSCFSCGGGSTMGYKLAGYQVIGNLEIDPRVNKVYQDNHHPRYSYTLDIRELVEKEDLPVELYHLDVLDGSPPCSVFSMAGGREKGWGKEKVFREGQEMQRLDDLFFHFINAAKKLQPKIVIAENVEGLRSGKARGYVNQIIKGFDAAGYDVQMFSLNSALMGVPQKRSRCFFIARRKDLVLEPITLNFNEKPILFGEVRSEHGTELTGKTAELMKKRKPTDRKISDINKRFRGKTSGFTNPIVGDRMVAPTLTSAGTFVRMCDGMRLSKDDIIAIQTFPQDYDFGDQQPQYVAGMSVPPVMMANIADEVRRQWLE